jgi:hypothetical protein
MPSAQRKIGSGTPGGARRFAEVKLKISGHLDEYAEKALDELKYQFQKHQSA